MRQEPYVVRSKQRATGPLPDCSVGEYTKKKIDQMSPDKIVLIDASTDTKITNKQLDRQANEAAFALIEKFGIEPNETVLMYGDNCIEYFIVYLSMVYLGLANSPITPANGPYETGQQIAQLNGKYLIISRSKLPVIRQMMNDDRIGGPLIASLKLLVVLDEKENEVIEELTKHRNSPKMVTTFQELINTGTGKQLENIPHFPIENPETHPFIVVFTSGTTGQPKGAIRSHRSTIASVEASQYTEVYRITYGSAVGFVFPFGHISGSTFSLTFLARQMTSVLFSQYSDDLYLEAIERYRIELVPFLPTFCNRLHQIDCTKLYDLSSMKSMIFGGMKFPKNQLDIIRNRYKTKMFELFGATEFLRPLCKEDEDFPYGCLGSPIPNVELKIVDLKSGENLSANQQGEICMRGPNCFVGYLNNPKATRETIDSDGWYHSGDVGYYDTEERLYFKDRIKELIKYKHWSVTPSEIETFLETHPAVSTACVIGVPHQTEGSHLRAFVVIAEGTSITEQELMDYVKENMGYQKRLNGGVRFIEKISRTSIGKIDRKYYKTQVKDELLTEPAPV